MDTLLEMLKVKLGKTYELDDSEKQELTTILEDGIQALKDYFGYQYIDFEEPGNERRLLINYGLYAYNHCEDEFFEAYKKEIVSLQAKYEVVGYEE